MSQVFSVLGTAMGNIFRPKTRLAKAIAPLLLIKIALIITARIFWFGPMTHHVVPDTVADRLVTPEAQTWAGNPQGATP